LDHENIGGVFFRKIRRILIDYTALHLANSAGQRMVRSCSEVQSEIGKVWDRLRSCLLPTISNTEFGMFSLVLSFPPVEYRIQKGETEFLSMVV
jgi:hypothetical protein